MKKPIQRIAIIGMPLSGKTTIGYFIGREIDAPCIDLDSSVEATSSKSLAEIFKAEGEEGFRKREMWALRRSMGLYPLVLPTGGGVVELAENRSILKEYFFTIWLHADIKVLAARSTSSDPSRPLIPDAKAIQKLYERRAPWYKECSRLHFDTSKTEPDAAAAAILNEYYRMAK